LSYFVTVQAEDVGGFILSIDHFTNLPDAINHAEELLIDHNSSESSYFYSYPYSDFSSRCEVVVGGNNPDDQAEPVFKISLIKGLD
jgi:hypothetical protein